MQKYYWSIGIVILVIIASVVWINFKSNQTESDTALLPYVDFEATVISLSPDESENYYEGTEIVNAPDDSAIVRIDRIIKTGGSYNFDWSSIGIEEGKETSLNFGYTIRPAKIITVAGETTQNGGAVSHQIVPTRIIFENGYFVFRVNGNSETETVLPGLQKDSKFKTRLWQKPQVEVEKYEIIA